MRTSATEPAEQRVARDRPEDPLAGWFGPRSESWRLDREAYLLLGAGPRALLLQLAHPLVAEGVAQHSDFRADPWGRLRGTLRSYLRIIYGTSGQARAEVRRLNRLHRAVGGQVRDPVAREIGGATYSARDPHLSLWVHATLIESTLAVYEAWREPLGPGRRARFYAESVPLGRAFGIPDELLPGDLSAFERYWEEMLAPGGPIRVSPTARDLASTVLHPPLGPLPSFLYDWVLWAAVDLLPPRLRREYGVPWTTLRACTSNWLVAGFRAWRPVLPTSLRWMPQARAADSRLRAAGLAVA